MKDFFSLTKLLRKAAGRLTPVLFLLVILLAPLGVGEAQEGRPGWSRPIDITQPSNSVNALYGAILCDPYQNTHVLWSDRAGQEGVGEMGAEIYYRNDIGGNWSIPMDVLALPDSLAIRLSAGISSRDDTIHLLWVNQWIRGDLFYSNAPLQEASNPRAWSEPIVLATATEAGYMAIDQEGVLHVVYEATDSTGYEVAIDYVRSDDSGLTWSDPASIFYSTVPVPSSATARIAADGAGRLHVGIAIRSQEYGIYSQVGYVRSADGGQVWSDYRIVDDDTTSFQGMAVLAPYAFGENEIHLTWHDPRRLHQWSLDGGETWSEPVEIMDLGAAFGGPNALAKDSAGILHVVTAVRGGVYSASWDGSSWGPRQRIDSRWNDPHTQDIAVCQGNKLQVIYDDRNDEQRVWYSSTVLSAPHLEPQPLPPLASDPAVPGTESAEPEPEAVSTAESSPAEVPPPAFADQPAAPAYNPMRSLLFSTVPVLVLILLIFTVQRRR